jgi:hypothetical protein
MIRDYVEKLEGDEFLNAQAAAWVEIREWVEDTVAPMVETETGGSVNGPGSSLSCTMSIREWLPGLLRRYQIRSMLDAPCGDWTWMSRVDLGGIHYVGWDIDLEQIRRNRDAYERKPGDYSLPLRLCHFYARNILTVAGVPRVDLILCRDFLAHLPTEHIIAVLDKFRASGSAYLLASNYPGADNEFDYHPEHYAWLGYCERPHDLEQPPFNLAKIDSIPEDRAPGGVISNAHELGLFRL